MTIIPPGGTLKENLGTKIVKTITKVTKDGKEYIDKYGWTDTLNFKESKSGIYNVESVKDVTGDDLTYDDETYYVDEKGTEAAAVTRAQMRLTSVSRPYRMTVDRPFLFFIADSQTDNILFVGKVVNL